MTTNLRAELARCDAEIARCEAQIYGEGTNALGALIGLRDWTQERRWLEAAMAEGERTDFVQDIEERISRGESNACLIPWASPAGLFPGLRENDPQASIEAAIENFIAAGWKWRAGRRQLEKGGWYLWFRSQGTLSSPIAQWNALPASARSEAA